MPPSLEHSIWFQEQDFAFIYLPKVACTSWKLYLWQASGHGLPSGLHYRDVHDPTVLTLPYVNRMPSDQQETFLKRLQQGELMAMAVIREPKSRVLSAYLDKILLHTNPKSQFSRIVLPAIRAAFGLVGEQRPSFEQFLLWNRSQHPCEGWNPHWRPMVHLLGDRQHLQLWPMEQMSTAVTVAGRHLGRQLPFPTAQALGPRPTNNSQWQMERFYGPQEQKLVQEMYGEDIELHAALVA